ncbi:hypothetical protein BC831DRAFT_468391 [Entophlyctis helioformis]|nr:hypothetical protein BC831DRAFT_468391 [Entophlyctis helioformis]
MSNGTAQVDYLIIPQQDFAKYPILAIVFGAYGIGNFVALGLKHHFTRTIISLIVINIFNILLQTLQLLYLYLPAETLWVYTARNWMYPTSICLLNLLQLEIFANMVYLRSVTISIMAASSLGCFVSPFIWGFDEPKGVRLYSSIGPAVYASLVALWGISQNLVILHKVQDHIKGLASNESSSQSKKAGGRVIQAMVLALLLLDIAAVVCFIVSLRYPREYGTPEIVTKYSLQQLSFGIIGTHMFGETFLFDKIAAQFRKHTSGSGSRNKIAGASKSQGSINTLSTAVSPPPMSPPMSPPPMSPPTAKE